MRSKFCDNARVATFLSTLKKRSWAPAKTPRDRRATWRRAGLGLAFGAAVLASSGAALADEAIVGGFAHDVPLGFTGSGRERGQDVEFGMRTDSIDDWKAIGRPQLYSFISLNDAQRTNFVSVGASWRRRWFGGRLYGQIGLGLAAHDHYDKDPAAGPHMSSDEIAARLYINRNFVGFGSRLLFQPEAALGVRLTPHWAAEATWAHISNAFILAHIDPGMNDLGLRVVYRWGDSARR